MSKVKAPISAISRYIPAGASDKVLDYLNRYHVQLTITKERKSVLGDYRHATSAEHHRISINGNLNPYSFLITLIHELSHLVTFTRFGNRVDPHGREWKAEYGNLMADFLKLDVFPSDLKRRLADSLNNLPASSCSDDQLIRVLRQYGLKKSGLVLVEQLPEGALFESGKQQVFRRGRKLRKRFECTEVQTGKLYLFSPVYEVKQLAS